MIGIASRFGALAFFIFLGVSALQEGARAQTDEIQVYDDITVKFMVGVDI
jgi:hypothetical protein